MKQSKRLAALFAVVCLMISALSTSVFGASLSTETGVSAATGKAATTLTDGDADPVYDCTGRYVNIALVIDVTGSMSGEINMVKENLTAFVREIEASGAIARISIIEYQDIQCDGDDSTIVHETPDYSVWFEDTDAIVEEIEALEVGNGGDIPESLFDALGYVVDDETMTFNEAAAKFAIVVTDAGYNYANNWGIVDDADMIARLNAKGIQTTVVTYKDSTTSMWDDETGSYIGGEERKLLSDVYAPLTEGTGGTIIDLNDDFSVALSEYAKRIIATTAEKEIDESYVPVTSITLEKVTDEEAVTNGILKFRVTVNPTNATVKDVYWTISDTSIATINTELTNSEYCVINTLKEGTTTLVAKTADGGYTATFNLTVKEYVVDGETVTTGDVTKAVELITTTDAVEVKVVFDSTKTTKIDETILEEIMKAIKDEGKSVVLSFVDADGTPLFTWTFAGSKITDASVAITDFKIDTTASIKAVDDAVKALGVSDVYSKTLHFYHEGALPGEASITVPVSTSAKALYLYYYNPTTGKLELADETVTLKDGFATFEITHCSDYVLLDKLVKPAVVAPAEKPAAPKTGDVSNVLPMVVLAAGFVLAFVAVKRRKSVNA